MTIIQFNPHAKGNRRQDDAHPEGRQHARQHTHEDASQRIAPGIRFVPGSLTEVRIDPNWLGSGVCADRDKGLSFYVLVLSYCVQDDPDDDPDPGAPAQAGWCQLQKPYVALIGRLHGPTHERSGPVPRCWFIPYRVPLPAPDRTLLVIADGNAEIDGNSGDEDDSEDEKPPPGMAVRSA